MDGSKYHRLFSGDIEYKGGKNWYAEKVNAYGGTSIFALNAPDWCKYISDLDIK